MVLTGALAMLLRPDPMSAAARPHGLADRGPASTSAARSAALAKLHHLEHGGTWVVLSMALAWGSDTGGYFAGRAFGKHKLYEKVSPEEDDRGRRSAGWSPIVG